jgi:CheY-like chemotaxis protein
MDVMMPNMNGLEAARRIVKEVPTHEQPIIIALTANAFEECKDQCLAAGMKGVLTKPLVRNDLVELFKDLSIT